MTIKDFVDKVKETHLYLSLGVDKALRVYVDSDGCIDFDLENGETVSIGLLDEINRDTEVETTQRGLYVCVIDRDGFGDWWIYTNSEDSFDPNV